MINLRNLASRRSNISANSNSKEKFQNQVKHQDPDTMTISAITPNGCTTSTLMVVGCQRIGRRATKGLHRKETQTLLTKDPPRTISRAELQTVARGRPRPIHTQTSILHVTWKRNQPSHQRLPHLHRDQTENGPSVHPNFATTTTLSILPSALSNSSIPK
jgi:hypothetical protein